MKAARCTCNFQLREIRSQMLPIGWKWDFLGKIYGGVQSGKIEKRIVFHTRRVHFTQSTFFIELVGRKTKNRMAAVTFFSLRL